MNTGKSFHDPKGTPRRCVVGTIDKRGKTALLIGRTYRRPIRTPYRLAGCVALLACIATNDPQGVSYGLHNPARVKGEANK